MPGIGPPPRRTIFDALEIEHPVEQSCCKVRRDGEVHLCAYYLTCGYQCQKTDLSKR